MRVPPMAHVKSVRMKKAQALLGQKQLGIAEIGAAVGLPDIFHFSKAFKQTFGVSPSQYRRDLVRWTATDAGVGARR